MEKEKRQPFPSGHSVTAVSNYGTILERYKKYKGLCVFMVLMILLTG